MKKIDLERYSIGGGNSFDMRRSLVAVLFNERVDPREVLRRDELATKIETQDGDTLLLEDADYARVVSGLNATNLTEHGRDVVEFIKRVLNAPTVDVQERQ